MPIEILLCHNHWLYTIVIGEYEVQKSSPIWKIHSNLFFITTMVVELLVHYRKLIFHVIINILPFSV